MTDTEYRLPFSHQGFYDIGLAGCKPPDNLLDEARLDPPAPLLDKTYISREDSSGEDWGDLVKSEPIPEAHAFRTITCLSCASEFKAPIWCGDRLCPVCARARANRYRKAVRAMLEEGFAYCKTHPGYRVRFITLTLKNVPDGGLDGALRKINSSWGKLRERKLCCPGKRCNHRDKYWDDLVRSAVSSVETSNQGNGWHVHLHAIVVSRYLDQQLLSDVWHRLTGDSYVVDIRQVKSLAGAVRELAKYPFKPAEADGWTAAQKAEFGAVFDRRRLYRTYGAWYGVSLVPKGLSVCSECGAVGTLVDLTNIYLIPSYDNRGCVSGIDRTLQRLRQGVS